MRVDLVELTDVKTWGEWSEDGMRRRQSEEDDKMGHGSGIARRRKMRARKG